MDINNKNINGLIINDKNIKNQNINQIKDGFISPYRRINTEYDDKNININQEFNDLVEKISRLLKDYFNNDNLILKI